MLDLERILLPVDFRSGRTVLPDTRRLWHATSNPSSMYFTYSTSAFTEYSDWGWTSSTASAFAPEQRIAANSRLEPFLADGVLQGLRVKRVLLSGDPGREIVKYAHSHKFGLIVLPTHGYGPFRQFLSRFRYRQGIARRGLPCLDGSPHGNAPVAQSPSVRRVLCALDLGPQSSKTLSWAWKLTRELGGELTIVHGVPGIPGGHSDFGNWQPILGEPCARGNPQIAGDLGYQHRSASKSGNFLP